MCGGGELARDRRLEKSTIMCFHNNTLPPVCLQVLYHALPVMLDGCTEDKLKSNADEPIVIDQAVDFLQSLFDLLTKLHVHLEVSRLFT